MNINTKTVATPKVVSTTPVIQLSTNYDDFVPDPENRDFRSNPRLRASMEKHGFLPECPIVVVWNNTTKKWEIRNGRHRFHYGKELGLPIPFVEATNPSVPILDLNNDQFNWRNEDYIKHYIKKGNRNYIALQAFLTKAAAFRSNGWGVMGVTTAAGLIHFGKCPNGGGAGLLINDGNLKANYVSHAENVLMRLAEIHADWDKKGTGLHLRMGRGMTQIVCALCHLAPSLSGFDWGRFRHAICTNANIAMFDGNAWEQSLELLQAFYNKALPMPRRVRFRGVVADYINS